VVRKSFPGVRLIRNSSNDGFARACNMGIEETDGDYVLLLNPDTIMKTGALRILASFMDEHPEAGGCGPKIFDGKGTPSAVMFGWRLPNMLFTDTFVARMFPWTARLAYRYPDGITEVPCISGSCMMLRRTALREAGLLNENLFLYYEEPELFERFRKKGWRAYYVPAAEIVHFGERSTSLIQPVRKQLINKRSLFVYWRTRYGSFTTRILKVILLLLTFIDLILTAVRIPFRRQAVRDRLAYYRSLAALLLGLKVPGDNNSPGT